MKILLVHGIGRADAQPNYYRPWIDAITDALGRGGLLNTNLEFAQFHYDDLFERYYHGPGVYSAALAQFLATAAWHWVTDPITNLFRPSRGFPNPYGDSNLRWTGGMVAQFAVEDGLRKALRERLRGVLRPEGRDGGFQLIAAHSLGTLLTYDFFRHDPAGRDALRNGVYLTFGSQINNDFARSRIFPGRITVPNVRAWYHLFNDRDPVLTAPIRLSDPRFRQVLTSSPAGHAATGAPTAPGYLDHPRTQSEVWNVLARQAAGRELLRTDGLAATVTTLVPEEPLPAPARLKEKPQRRALIIGINEYPNPAHRLEGSVNDAFLMSELLQERGFAAENIRLVLDERATADAIRERLAWLLYRAEDGMERVLFFAGHGAQIPGRNGFEEVDHVDECLVPYDFDWTEQRAITDKDFYRLYSDLPFGARFFAMFDCCHSGGLTRSGAQKVRALDPPDDIRHRMMRWDPQRQMWLERELPEINSDFGGTEEDQRAYMGSNHATYRLGRAMRLRRVPVRKYEKLDPENKGPYLPVLLEACGEGQLAYEYRHGVTSYGAFTYSVVKTLRTKPRVTFNALLAAANDTLKWLGYEQRAQIIGPRPVLGQPVPGDRATSPNGKTSTARRASKRKKPK